MAFFQARRSGNGGPVVRSPRVRKVFGALGWVVAGFGFVVFFGINLSPLFGDSLSLLFEDTERVEARISTCEPLRNGVLREHVIRCSFSYSHQGQPYQAQDSAWRSQSPFLTADGLGRVLAEQTAFTPRWADIRTRRPGDARLADQRLLAMPPLWLWLLALVVALMTAIVKLDPYATRYRRAELTLDRTSGQLEDTQHRRRHRLRWLAALKALTALTVIGICLYGLSNRPANVVKLWGFSKLQAVPAQLVNCAAHRRGGYRGHDQIECGFDYTFQGQTLRGQAESLDFRYFPTRARIAAEVEKLQPSGPGPAGPATVAYVDPQHPGYAMAFISNAWWVKFSWGLLELELGLALLVAAGFLLFIVRGALRPQE